jgi:hypothetical protein
MVSRLGVPRTRVRGYLPAGLRPFQCAVERSEKLNKSEKIKLNQTSFKWLMRKMAPAGSLGRH